SPVKFDYRSSNREPQSQAAEPAVRSVVCLCESFKNERKKLRIDSDTGVGDLDDGIPLQILLGIVSGKHHRNPSTFWSELNGLAEQVRDDLLYACGVYRADHRLSGEQSIDDDIARLRLRKHLSDGGFHQRYEIGQLRLDFDLVANDSSQVKKVLD